MKKLADVRAVETTVGEIIVAAMDSALEVCHSEARAYQITSLVVNTLLSRSADERKIRRPEQAWIQ